MDDILYLESDEEITSVIDRIKNTKGKSLGLVIPREATVLQSVVNLRLLSREAENLGKEIAVITSDKIGRNLAAQVGLVVYASVKDDKPIFHPKRPVPLNEEVIEIDARAVKHEESKTPAGIKVHHFQEEKKHIAEPMKEEIRHADVREDENLEEEGETFKDDVKFESKTLEDESEYDNEPIKISEPDVEKRQNHREINSGSHKVLWTIFAVLIVLMLIGGFLLLPKADVVVSVMSENLKKSIPIVVSDKNSVDGSETVLTGNLIELIKDAEEKFVSTGKKNIGEKAKGSVLFYNSWDSSNHPFPAGTKLVSSGKVFVSTNAFSIPGYARKEGKDVPGSVTVPVEAENVGEDYNIKAGRFDIISLSAGQQQAIYGTSSLALAGGLSKEVQVVSEEDYNNAKNKIIASLTELTVRELRMKNQDKKIVDKALVVSEPEIISSAKVDQEAKEFDMKVSLKAQAIVFDFPKLKELLVKTLEDKVPSDKMVVIPSDEDMGLTVDKTDYEKGELSLTANISAKIASKISQDKIKTMLLGKNEKEAIDILKTQDGVFKVEIQFSPNFLRRVPDIEKNVSVSINYLTE